MIEEINTSSFARADVISFHISCIKNFYECKTPLDNYWILALYKQSYYYYYYYYF